MLAFTKAALFPIQDRYISFFKDGERVIEFSDPATGNPRRNTAVESKQQPNKLGMCMMRLLSTSNTSNANKLSPIIGYIEKMTAGRR